VKYCFRTLLCAALLTGFGYGQSAAILYTTDVNGHRVAEAEFLSNNGDRAELNRSINGRTVPLERSEAKVLTDEPNHKITETIVRKYDANGELASTERTVAEEFKSAAGSSIKATVYRSDANGRLQEGERRVIETHVQGATTSSDVTIARVGLSGSFETAEKRKVITMVEGTNTRQTETVERPAQGDLNFTEVSREVKESQVAGDKTVSNTARYELNYTGKMALIRQENAITTKKSDGTQVTELNRYAPAIYGIARDEHSGPALQEQQVIVRKEGKGTVEETTSVRRPTLADPNRLGEPKVISDLVCTGKCAGPLQP